MSKKILAMLLAVCMVVSVAPAAMAADAFSDVAADAWYSTEVEWAYSEGLMNGTGDGQFSPAVSTTRGMIVTILWRMEGEPAADGEQFSDVAGDAYYAEAVKWAAANKIVEGYGDGKFGPADLITREQLATIMYRYAQYKGYDVSASDDLGAYTDADDVHSWAAEAMKWAAGAGLISGMTEDTLAPQGEASRAQVAVILYRFADEMKPAPEETPSIPVHFHSYENWTPNNNGKHTGTCTCNAQKSEDCAYGDDTICDKCGFDKGAEAKIGTAYYATLEEAVAIGGEVIVLKDVELEKNLTIDADETVVIDLNGKTVTYNSTVQGEAMITNKGTLTINDSVGEGVINYNYTGEADSSYGKGNYTISNGGTLTVNGGKITIAKLSGHAKYPIDNNSTTGDAVLVINGGHLYNYNTSAIRQFCNSTTNKNSVTINGGLIEGYCAIWVQNPGSKTVNGDLTVTGGELKSTAKAYVEGTSELKDVSSSIYFTIAADGGAWSEGSFVTLTGGTFNENVNLAYSAPAPITIGEGATFNGNLWLPAASIGTKTYTTLGEAISAAGAEDVITLVSDIDVDADTTITIASGKTITLDLNGKTLAGETDGTGNREMFLVKGMMNVRNGTITLKHVGENMEWNSMTTVFDVTAGGVLNLDGVTVENLGGSDMAFCVHMNNWGEVTLKADNCSFESTYGGIRAFNSGYDMNNIAVTNSTIHGTSMALWVHNYTAADFGNDTAKAEAAAARLNFDIFGGTNTITAGTDGTKETPVRYGFTDALLLTANGSCLTADKETIADILASGGEVTLSENVAAEAATTAPYGNKYGFKLDGGVLDGNGKKLDVECDGDDYGVMTSGGTVKNLTIENGTRAIMIMYPTQDIILDNVKLGGDGVLYPINTGEAGSEGVKLIVSNSTIKGWTSFSNIESASFTNCEFGQGTYYNDIYGRVLKPYVNTTLTGCSFIEHMNLDLSALGNEQKVTIKNCTVNGQAVTADVFTVPGSDAEYDTELFTVDLPSWATSISDCVIFE